MKIVKAGNVDSSVVASGANSHITDSTPPSNSAGQSRALSTTFFARTISSRGRSAINSLPAVGSSLARGGAIWKMFCRYAATLGSSSVGHGRGATKDLQAATSDIAVVPIPEWPDNGSRGMALHTIRSTTVPVSDATSGHKVADKMTKEKDERDASLLDDTPIKEEDFATVIDAYNASLSETQNDGLEKKHDLVTAKTEIFGPTDEPEFGSATPKEAKRRRQVELGLKLQDIIFQSLPTNVPPLNEAIEITLPTGSVIEVTRTPQHQSS